MLGEDQAILLGSRLEDSHLLASQVTGWMLATDAHRPWPRTITARTVLTGLLDRSVRRAGRDRGARPGPARGPPARTAPRITGIG